VKDNIFDKVFRGVYEKEIRQFDPKVIREEYKEELKKKGFVYRRFFCMVRIPGGKRENPAVCHQ
jgi:hypothetical protein